MKKTDKDFVKKVVFYILIGGSVWGLSEVALSEIIVRNGLPLRASILTGIAFLIMGVLSGLFRKAHYMLFLVIPAILIVQMGVVLCGNSVLCRTNTCVALVSHAGMLSAGFYLTGMGRGKTSLKKTVFLGSAAALSSAVAFYFVGMKCAPCPYLLSFNSAAGFISYLYAEALPWMIFSGAGFSIGYFLGDKEYQSAGFSLLNLKTPHYITGLAVSLVCWIASAGIILG